ncbi:MAG: methyltransferase domain-containing protein [Saprospiraceae bacterium]
MKLKKTHNGNTNLHLWTYGNIYELVYHCKDADEWNNIIFCVYPYPDTAVARTRDIRKGIPYADNTFEHIVVTRVIEHLTLDENKIFLLELHRVLCPNGIIRFSTPDLTQKVQTYIDTYDQYKLDPTEANYNSYHWAVLDLNDQSSRNHSGGLMLPTARSGMVSKSDMRASSGDVMDYILAGKKPPVTKPHNSVMSVLYGIVRSIIYMIKGTHPHTTREANMWMYDQSILRDVLVEAGFGSVSTKDYHTSDIADYNRYAWDTSPHGDYDVEPSLYIEALKPIK